MDQDKPLVWVTGARGLIGNYLVQTAGEKAPGWRVRGLARADADLTDFGAVERLFRQEAPRFILHCAALSRGVECQENPARARLQNVEVTRHLSRLASDIPFIFMSTDLVFDGRQGGYSEHARTNPLSVYGETKAEAEAVVLSNAKHCVVRTSINGGTSPAANRGFNEDMRRAWMAGRSLTLFTDEFRNPIPAVVTARAFWELVERFVPGIYHLAGTEKVSRWRLGELIAARWPQLQPKIQPGLLAEYQGPPRPADTSMHCSKLQRLLSFPLPGISEWLAQHPNEVF